MYLENPSATISVIWLRCKFSSSSEAQLGEVTRELGALAALSLLHYHDPPHFHFIASTHFLELAFNTAYHYL